MIEGLTFSVDYFDIEIELFSNLTQKEFVYVVKNKKIDQLKQLIYEQR